MAEDIFNALAGKYYDKTTGTWQNYSDKPKTLTPEQQAADAEETRFNQRNFYENSYGHDVYTDWKYRNDPEALLRAQGNAETTANAGWNPQANLNFYTTNGDPNFEKNQSARLFGMADAMAGRTGPTVDTSGVNPLVGKEVKAGDSISGYGAAQARLAAMPTGPSAAELAMRQQGEQAQNAQASLAASARGGNSGLALQSAGANMALIAGQQNQNIGIQRAQEDLANRNFALNAYGAAAGTTGQAAGVYGQGAGLRAQIAGQNASLEVGQRGLNDTTGLAYNNAGLGVAEQGTANRMGYDKSRSGNYLALTTNNYNNRDRTGEGTITGSAGGDKLLGAGITTGGTLLAASDIRAKTRIAPAADQVDDTFRGLGSYGYDYREPNAPGAAPGRHFGPMAQELEQTPIGKSVVTQTPDGKKGIDTGRLALANASETARLRQELDAIKNQAGTIRDMRVEYPGQSPKGLAPPETPLVYSEDNGGTFRTPDEQLHYSRGLGAQLVRRAPVKPTPLFYNAEGDTMLGASGQLAYSRGLGATALPAETRIALAKSETSPVARKTAALEASNAESDDKIRRLRAQLAGSVSDIGRELSQPTAYPAPQQPIAYGY